MVDIWPSPWIARRLEHMAAQVHERASQDGNLSERRLREEIALQKGRMRRAEHLGKGTGRGTLIESLALLNVYGRVANVLLDRAPPNADTVRTIRDKISRQDIAKMVGASREMVSRVMKDFEEQGFVQTREDGSLLIKELQLQAR